MPDLPAVQARSWAGWPEQVASRDNNEAAAARGREVTDAGRLLAMATAPINMQIAINRPLGSLILANQ
jgi:hypothetical protein